MKPFIQKLLGDLSTNRNQNSDDKITYTWKSTQVFDASLTALLELIIHFLFDWQPISRYTNEETRKRFEFQPI